MYDLFWHMYVFQKNYKRLLKFFEYIYQGLHISVSHMILSTASLKKKLKHIYDISIVI